MQQAGRQSITDEGCSALVVTEVLVSHQHPIPIWAKSNFSIFTVLLVARVLISGENTDEFFRHGRVK